MNEAPEPLERVRPDLPAELCAAVMRCLEKKRDARFADVGELAAVIAKFGSEDAPSAAKRIAKVLRRAASLPPPATAVDPAASGLAPTLMPTAASALTPPAPRRATVSSARTAEPASITGAVGQVGIAVAPPPRKTGLYVGIAGVAIAAVAIGVVVLGGHDSQTPPPIVQPAVQPAAQPPPQSAAPPPAAIAPPPAAAAPATDAKPPPAAIATPPTPAPVRPGFYIKPAKPAKSPDAAKPPDATPAKPPEAPAAPPPGTCRQKSDCAVDQACVAGECKKADLTRQLIDN